MSVEHKIAKAVSEDYLALQEEIKALKAQVGCGKLWKYQLTKLATEYYLTI